jgi:uncharacterized glyoxalase superfamily protein PhnB
MADNAPIRSTVIPGMHYRNAPEAIGWLCRVFGFQKHAVYPGPDNTIMHAELTLGGGMIMLGTMPTNEHGKYMRMPADIGGGQTRAVNLIVDDADEVYRRAKADKADIAFEIEDKPYGGRGFSCRDLEGHMWHIGTYNPWQSNK